MSKRSDQKKARRRKRRAGRDEAWVPARVVEQLEIASDLEEFDAKLTERGWWFNEDEEDSGDDAGVAWYWPPSEAEVADEDEAVNVTVVLLTPEDGGETAHVVLVGTSDDYQFNLDELFEHLDVIEAYRHGDPPPVF
ncbi:hypothetical protein [Mycolicibacterium austroafricanum]|uniref:hypothetical protein n=1 Tax=Mycolicibacterium austroafricanum TaxID=39687 RepID=UPI000CF882E8|nr:hypothetical protein [Mycolicibacterium austroafricanum]PQP41328.1 hypothetical protein C6A88_28750 [Mycolicibacterium austroafricanum]